jgi:anti-sigma factor RsiW
MSTRRWLFWRRAAAAPQPPGLSCRELVELVTAYLEDALAPDERARFALHIARCDDCTTYVEQLRMTIDVVGRLEPEALSATAERDLLAAFADWKAGAG